MIHNQQQPAQAPENESAPLGEQIPEPSASPTAGTRVSVFSCGSQRPALATHFDAALR